MRFRFTYIYYELIGRICKKIAYFLKILVFYFVVRKKVFNFIIRKAS